MTVKVFEAFDFDTAETITVVRTTGGAFVDGRFQNEPDGKGITQSTFRSVASVQQPTDRELQTLSQGDRDKDVLKFYSRQQLKTLSDRDGTSADIVLYKGNRYKIVSVADWDTFGFTSAMGVRDQ